MWVLGAVYNLEPAKIATAIEMLLNHQDLTVQDADAVAAALEHFRQRPALGFSDCLILEAARKAGHLPLGTFDRGLSKIAGAQRL
jgi:predicted nucleic-acid-binding protein